MSDTFADWLERLNSDPESMDKVRVEIARGSTEDPEAGEHLAQMQERINELDREAKRLNPNAPPVGDEMLRQELQKFRQATNAPAQPPPAEPAEPGGEL